MSNYKKLTKKQLIAALEEKTPSFTVSNNTFTGVHWDAKALEAVNNVSEGLLNLTKLFQSQNIKVDSLLKVNTEQ